MSHVLAGMAPQRGLIKPQTVARSRIIRSRMYGPIPSSSIASVPASMRTNQRFSIRSASHRITVIAGASSGSKAKSVQYSDLVTTPLKTPMGDVVTLPSEGKPVVLHLLRRFG